MLPTVPPLPIPTSATFDVIMAAQGDDGERLAAAVKLAETSLDPGTKASAVFYCQKHFLTIADPDIDLTDIHTIEAAQERLETLLATDADACGRLRAYFGAALS